MIYTHNTIRETQKGLFLAWCVYSQYMDIIYLQSGSFRGGVGRDTDGVNGRPTGEGSIGNTTQGLGVGEGRGYE